MANSTINIQPISIGGLEGRALRVGAKMQNPIVLIYGVHSSLERMSSTAEFLADYGQVYMPDLPGLGGMDSFYKINKKPTLDNYADYLYAWQKVRRFKHPVLIVGMSFGFLVATRMLQKYPDAKKQVREVVSFVGFGSADDFKSYSSPLYIALSKLLSTRLGGWLAKVLIFNRYSLRVMFKLFQLFNPKYKHAMENDPQASIDMELDLWQKNDARTRFALYVLLLSFDLTKVNMKIDTPLHDITTPTDQYFDHKRVARSLKKMYKHVSSSEANMKLHAPSIIGSKHEVSNVFSSEAKKIIKG